MVNQFNNATPENSSDPEKITSSKYYDMDEMHNFETRHKNKVLCLFHINACSLSKNFDGLQYLLSCHDNGDTITKPVILPIPLIITLPL